jgi:hypothetical protein
VDVKTEKYYTFCLFTAVSLELLIFVDILIGFSNCGSNGSKGEFYCDME